MKYSGILGMAAAIVIMIACYFPWAYYPDIGKTFTGFFSEGNAYGRPGRVLLPLSGVVFALFLIPRIWAKRLNLLVAVLTMAYCIKTFVLFSSCYGGVCPEKKPALYLMLISSVVIFIMSLIPDLRLKEK